MKKKVNVGCIGLSGHCFTETHTIHIRPPIDSFISIEHTPNREHGWYRKFEKVKKRK